MTLSGDSDIATRLKSSALELLHHFSYAQSTDSESKWPSLPIREVTCFKIRGSILPGDGGVRRLVHGGHTRAVELPGVALDVHLQRYRPHRGSEVVQPHLLVPSKCRISPEKLYDRD